MRRTLSALALLASAACGSEFNPAAPRESLSAQYGQSTTAPIPRALIVFSDLVNVAPPGAPENWQPAGVTGDGRLRDGTSSAGQPSNEYLGNLCGVSANIENGPRQGGDLDFDPDNFYSASTACGAARYYNFYLAGTAQAPAHLTPDSRVFGIWSLAVGQSVNKGQGFGVQLTNCQLLMFNSQFGVDDLSVTRTDNGTGPRRWKVATQGGHMAACVLPSKKAGVYTATGVKYFLPFSYSVTEVQ